MDLNEMSFKLVDEMTAEEHTDADTDTDLSHSSFVNGHPDISALRFMDQTTVIQELKIRGVNTSELITIRLYEDEIGPQQAIIPERRTVRSIGIVDRRNNTLLAYSEFHTGLFRLTSTVPSRLRTKMFDNELVVRAA